MISELGRRQVSRIRQVLGDFNQGRLDLPRLIPNLDALISLLLDEADSGWVEELQTQCNRLEFVNAARISSARDQLTADEEEEVADAIRQLELMLTEY